MRLCHSPIRQGLTLDHDALPNCIISFQMNDLKALWNCSSNKEDEEKEENSSPGMAK